MLDGIVMGRTENPLTISGSAAVEDDVRCRFEGRGFVIAMSNVENLFEGLRPCQFPQQTPGNAFFPGSGLYNSNFSPALYDRVAKTL